MYKKIHVFRVKPGQELLAAVTDYCRKHNLTSGVVIGVIGSVQSARLNFVYELPAKFNSIEYPGPLEIVGAQGTVALKEQELIVHIHLIVSGKDICRGGHLAEAKILSTGEVVIGELDYPLKRQFDSYTGLNELAE